MREAAVTHAVIALCFTSTHTFCRLLFRCWKELEGREPSDAIPGFRGKKGQ